MFVSVECFTPGSGPAVYRRELTGYVGICPWWGNGFHRDEFPRGAIWAFGVFAVIPFGKAPSLPGVPGYCESPRPHPRS